MDDRKNSPTSENLPNWFAVLDFLAGIIKPETTGEVIISRKPRKDWEVKLDLYNSTKKKNTNHSSRGAGLYDLYW